jgi:transposase
MAQHVAIDVHDRTLLVVAVDAETGEERLRRRFAHNHTGVEDLAARLGPGDSVVMEATRGSHSLANRLDRTGATVLIADAQRCRSIGLRGKKTDYRDCLALLTLLRCGELPTIWRPDAATRERRQLSRERHSANHQVTQLKNRLIALLREEGLFPPAKELLFGPEGDVWLAALALPATTVAILRRTWSLLQSLETAKQFQERAFAAVALTDPRALRLMQLPGFGPVVAAILLAEVGDFSRFPDGKRLVSYAGLDPRVDQSGDHRRLGHISRGGRSQLRWILVEAAWGHVIANGPEAGLYHRLVKRGKPSGLAIVALARHLLVLAYLLLTRHELYRGGSAESFLRKLQELASFRPAEQRRPRGRRSGQSDIGWARGRFRELTGQEPPPNTTVGTKPPAAPEPAPAARPAGGDATAPAPPAEKK